MVIGAHRVSVGELRVLERDEVEQTSQFESPDEGVPKKKEKRHGGIGRILFWIAACMELYGIILSSRF